MDRSLETVEEYRECFETMCSISPVGLFRTDEKGNLLYVNEKYEKITGKDFSELKKDGWLCAIHERDLPKVMTEWKRCIKSRENFVLEFRIKNTNGKITWVLGQATPLNNGVGKGFVGTITNINKRKKLLDELIKMRGMN